MEVLAFREFGEYPLRKAGGIIMNITEEQIQKVGAEVNKIPQYVEEQLPAVTQFAIRIVVALFVFWIGGKLIRWVQNVLRRSLGKARIDEGAVQFMCSLTRFILYALLIFNIAAYFGVKESSVAALLGTAGVTIGLALQGGLANIAGGMMLLLFKPFQVGDYIVQDLQGGCEGTVIKIEICYTTLLSVDNKHIVIPNGTLSNSTITNVTARDQRKLEVKVGISYNSDMHKAKEILEHLLKEDEDTKADEEMVVFVDSLADSAVIMGFRVWVPTERYWAAKWRLNERIKEEFDANGIEIPYNQLDVHVHQEC